MVWQDFLRKEIKEPYYQRLMAIVKQEYQTTICHPDYQDIWNAFKMTDLENVKVVILGQDPYHNYHQAHGLSFSVLCAQLPPSLVNIYQEMENDLGVKVRQDGNLSYLAKQGVLLLNTILTVRHGMPLSHKGIGWEILTDKVIQLLNQQNRPIVFVLWGKNAKEKQSMITNSQHLIITSSHPSPLSANYGFFGSRPFSRINHFLIEHQISPIQWYQSQENNNT